MRPNSSEKKPLTEKQMAKNGWSIKPKGWSVQVSIWPEIHENSRLCLWSLSSSVYFICLKLKADLSLANCFFRRRFRERNCAIQIGLRDLEHFRAGGAIGAPRTLIAPDPKHASLPNRWWLTSSGLNGHHGPGRTPSPCRHPCNHPLSPTMTHRRVGGKGETMGKPQCAPSRMICHQESQIFKGRWKKLLSQAVPLRLFSKNCFIQALKDKNLPNCFVSENCQNFNKN